MIFWRITLTQVLRINAVSWIILLSCLLDFQVPSFAYLGCLRSLLYVALSDLSPLQQITKHQYAIANTMHNYIGDRIKCFICDLLYILEQYQIVCKYLELIVTISNNNCDRIRIMYDFIMHRTLVFIYYFANTRNFFVLFY